MMTSSNWSFKMDRNKCFSNAPWICCVCFNVSMVIPGFPSGTVVSNMPPNAGDARDRFYSWVGKITWNREQEPTPVFFPGKFHRQRSLNSYSPWGCWRKRDPFQGPKLGSCLTLGSELSEETHVLTKQEILWGKGTQAESSRVREPRRTALPHDSQSRVL